MNEVSICNAALSYLGEKGTITKIKPPEGNPQAEACAEYYPQALRYLLEAHNWAFAIRLARLPEYKKYDADWYQWAHGYQVPSDYLRTVKVYEKSSRVDEAGLDFEIEQGGKNLSGGQRQRMTIARAVVKKPDILILDDSASALDFATDAKLRMAIRDMENKATVFIVSQRAASIMYADKIIVLDDGQIVGMGTHEELLKQCEVYQEIYYSQFKKTEDEKEGR